MAERETCLVTGASGGIGGAIALKMAAEGRNVVLHYAGNEAAARAIEEEIHKAYPSVETLLCRGDIKKEEDVERIVAEAVARFSEIEVLVNNAGITKDNLFLVFQSGREADDEKALRQNNSDFQHCGGSWKCGTEQLCGFQGGAYRYVQVPCPGAGRKKCDSKCGLSRLY